MHTFVKSIVRFIFRIQSVLLHLTIELGAARINSVMTTPTRTHFSPHCRSRRGHRNGTFTADRPGGKRTVREWHRRRSNASQTIALNDRKGYRRVLFRFIRLVKQRVKHACTGAQSKRVRLGVARVAGYHRRSHTSKSGMAKFNLTILLFYHDHTRKKLLTFSL